MTASLNTAAAMLPPTTAEKLAELDRRREESQSPMGPGAHDKVRRSGRMTARERLEHLLDPGSFIEVDQHTRHRTHSFGMESRRPATDGIITGWGTIDGREVCVFSQDGTVFGGALGEVYGEKMVKVMELAVTTGRPLVGLYEGAGARIQDGAVSLDLIAQTFRANTEASGVVPQISVIMGACAGGNAYSPALTDFVVMVENSSKMFVTGPDVITTVTGEKITQDELGGADVHMQLAGTSHFTACDDGEAIGIVQDLLSYLPSNNQLLAPNYPADDPASDHCDSSGCTPQDYTLDTIIPDLPTMPYDIKDVIAVMCDDDDYMEVQAERAANVVTAFGRINGDTVGFIANQPMVYAGCLDINAAEKAARFVRTCDSFNIPIIMLVDVPGFLPGRNQEHDGILRRGAKLLYAYAEATVPKITVTLRKAYGGAYCVMGSQGLGADVNLAWPTAEIAVMGAKGAVSFLHRKRIRQAEAEGEDVDTLRAQLERDYDNIMLNPYLAAERGLIDDVIKPCETRRVVAANLQLLRSKNVHRAKRKHGNIPL